jgi:hypothetical protein
MDYLKKIGNCGGDFINIPIGGMSVVSINATGFFI